MDLTNHAHNWLKNILEELRSSKCFTTILDEAPNFCHKYAPFSTVEAWAFNWY
jgi:hypothetical protein